MEMNEWVFQIAYGKYLIDLGDSNAPCRNISDLNPPKDFILNYGIDQGTLPLRKLIANLYGRSADEVIVTHGAQEALFLFYFSFLGFGDHVIAFKPGWKQSWEAPKKLGANVTSIELDPSAGLDIDGIRQAIRPETKAILLNSPCNPTGYSLSDSEEEALLDLAKSFNITLVCDDEYRVFLDNSIVNKDLEALSVSSLSKIYGLPGLRLGWALGNKVTIEKMRHNKHLTSISNSSYIEQIACNILKNRTSYIAEYLHYWKQGKKIIESWLKKHRNVFEFTIINEAPFCWVKLKIDMSSFEFCKKILDQESVLLMPSELFDAKGAFRITFARDPEELLNGLARIENVIKRVC